MAAPKAAWVLLSLGTSALALSIGGCRGTPQPVARTVQPAQKTPAAPPPPDLPSAANHSVPSQDVVAGKEHTAVPAVVVDPGTEEGGPPPSLIEASKAEKERRAGSAKAGTVINDKTLPRYASKGQITVMAPPKDKKKGTAGKAGAAAATAAPADVRDEAYWRGRGLEIRQRWRISADEVKALEQKSTELRQKFYMENDLFVRDNRIKPDWDRVLDRLRQARLDTEAARQELSDFLEEGRRAGVLAGWLRDGEDDEPVQASGKGQQAREQSKGRDGLPPAQSIEPPILDDKEQSRRPPPARGESRDNHKDNKLKNPRNAGDPGDGDGR